MIARVLLVIKGQNRKRQLKRFLSAPDIIIEFPQHKAFWKDISREIYDLLVVEEPLLPNPPTSVLESFKAQTVKPALVVLTDKEDAEERAHLLTAGCEAVLFAGLPTRELATTLKSLLGRQLQSSRETLASKRDVQEARLEDFVSNSPIMKEFMDMVQRVVSSNTSLLILGETGVGKERLARAIHRASDRGGAFVAVNCGALTETLLESELFGHEEGAFTGANRARRGCFELAHTGTIFLDEIGDLPLHLQVRLLRVLQEREVQRVGAEWPIRIDVRVMAATSRDLDEMTRKGQFRSDLMYRLSVVSLKVPPLRERKEDIRELVNSYIEHFAQDVGREVGGIVPEAVAALERYDWPGNIRELINVIERTTLLCSGPIIQPEDLPAGLKPDGLVDGLPDGVVVAGIGEVFPEAWLDHPLRQVKEGLIQHIEKAYLIAQLRITKGNIGKTAIRAGITSRALYDKMKLYQLRKEDFRAQLIPNITQNK